MDRAEHQAFRMQEARKIMGFALKDSPEAYYNAIDKPPLARLAEQAVRHTAAEYAATHGEKSHAIDLFCFGIEDSSYPLLVALAKRPNASREELEAIMNDEETIKTQARVARFSQEQSTELYFHRTHYFDIAEDGQSVVLAQPLASPTEFGCPATQYGESGIEATPLFYRFTRWAGSLAIHAHFEHTPQ